MKTIFDACTPRPDVKSGSTKDEAFAADLAQVVNGSAPTEYLDPAKFFSRTYPTRGLKQLLKAVCQRVSGTGGEVASIIRLHTQYGGGKTHGLIALVHAVRGMKGVKNVEEFVDPVLLPKGTVRVAALDGENADPANGLTLEGDLRAYSLWGELAYRLAGVPGFERVRESDRTHTAPGAETIRELFGGEPVLIMLDEISVYLRKIERAFPGASGQFTAFVHALFKAVTSSPQVALVYTLAVGKDDEARDAYKAEHERALQALGEAERVAARSATQLNPTEEDETADVLRRRLFEKVDLAAADQVIAAYDDLWKSNREHLPEAIFAPETKEQFRRGYPLHPEVLNVLTRKTSSLSTFHRTRGMLRLLARTVHDLWDKKPADAWAIHPHHIDPGFGPIRDEITVRLGQGDYTPALKADVAAVSGDEPSLALLLDQKYCPGELPVHQYIARTIFLNTLAYGDDLKGLNSDQLNFSVCSPKLEPSFIEQARRRFVSESLFMDDRPGASMRFMVEPNLTQMIRKKMADIDTGQVRSELNERIRGLFSAPGGAFNMIPFPSGAYEVPDDTGDNRPYLLVMGYEAVVVTGEPKGPPSEIEDIYKHKGNEQKLREYRNNLVFVVADERLRENMKDRVRRRLALLELRKPENIRTLADHQQRIINEDYEKSSLEIAETILHCYRHLFYPSHMPMAGAIETIAHTVIEVANASDQPGNGQQHVGRILREQKKLLAEGDQPDAPAFVRDQTPLKIKGELTTLELRNEFRKAPKLSILLSNNPLIACIRQGIEMGVFIYREGNQVWGKGDPAPSIQISENSFVHTLQDAKHKHLWPRPEPLRVRFSASPTHIKPGQTVELSATVEGGTAPFTYACSEPGLSHAATAQTEIAADVAPEASVSYQLEVTDSRGQRESATAAVMVGSGPVPPPAPPAPPPAQPRPPAELSAKGPLAQALTELWEKLRKAGQKRIQRLIVKFYEAPAAWKVHQAMATLHGVSVIVHFESGISGDGIEEFEMNYTGSLAKANAVKAFLDPQIRAADDHTFEAVYTISFEGGLATTGEAPEKLAKDMTRYGAGEAYVEAHAAAPEDGI